MPEIAPTVLSEASPGEAFIAPVIWVNPKDSNTEFDPRTVGEE